MTMKNFIYNHIDEIKSLCEQYQVKELNVFGSLINGHYTDQSDIDFLVVFEDSEIKVSDFNATWA